MTIEEILAALKAITDAAEGRALTDEEMDRYEDLEGKLVTARRELQIRSRQTAYQTPHIPSDLAAAVHTGTAREDDTLNRAFNHYLRTGQPNADIAALKSGDFEVRAQGVGTDSIGGYTVSPQFRQKLVDVRKSFGGLAPEVDSFTTARGGDLEYPSVDDTANQGAITAESAAFTSGNDLAFGTVALKAFKYTSTGGGSNLPLRVSVELLQDSEFDIEGLVARKLGMRIARKQATDWVNGTGTTLPFGIAHSGLTQDVTLATGNAVTYQKLLDLETLLDPEYEQNAKWVMSKGTWSKVRGVVDGSSRPLIFDQAASGMAGRPEKTLLGYPVVIDQAFASVPVTGAMVAVLGDLQEGYVIRRVADVTVVVNPYSRAINGEVEYVAWERADGNIQNRKSYVVLKTANS